MKPLPLLYDFRKQFPSYYGTQEECIAWLAAAHAKAEAIVTNDESKVSEMAPRFEKLIRRFGCSPKHIGWRGTELEDFSHREWQQMQVFNIEEAPEGKGLDTRNQFFANTVNRAVERFYENDEPPPADLIHVTCTGYASPSAIQRLVDGKAWHSQTRTTQIYHMGCYASIPALRVTTGLMLNQQNPEPARADVVHTELCSLHFNPKNHSPEQLVVQSLFADGFIRYSMAIDEDVAKGRPTPAFEVLSVREEMVANSLEDMTWVVSEFGFRMTLSRDVPNKIANSISGFLERLFAQGGENYAESKPTAVFAIHPGGPKIIDTVQELIDVSNEQTTQSRAVLFERGNMSSATLPHIWSKVLDDDNVKSGTLVASIGFGPGLTMAGALFRKR
ncbi:MAG: 3-oxoacyl-[acyl-carrier-protein] synthase III C-terminal domain-containing protein [Acidobacteriota bacterium]